MTQVQITYWQEFRVGHGPGGTAAQPKRVELAPLQAAIDEAAAPRPRRFQTPYLEQWRRSDMDRRRRHARRRGPAGRAAQLEADYPPHPGHARCD
ncbi:MAG: hypothetical protein R2851_15360 [Caldilineaceae bacterium]